MTTPRELLETYFQKALRAAQPEAALSRFFLKKRVLSLLYGLFRGMTDEELVLRSMSLVYTTLLSIVPLLAFSFSVLKAFGAHTRFEIFLYYLLEPMGDKGIDLSMKVIGFVENVNVSVLGSIGLSVLVYTVISQIQKVESALNYIWNIKSARNMTKRFSTYMSVLLIGPVLIFSAIGITASLMSSSVVKSIVATPHLGQFALFLGSIIPYLLASSAFAFIYLMLPNTSVRPASALCGGLFAGAAWKFMGWAFAHFVASSAKYSAIYSGFAILILSLIWLYWCWFTVLLGARIAYAYQYPLVRSSREALSPAQREYAGLAVMTLVARNFLGGKPGLSLNSLVQQVGITVDEMQSFIDLFEKAGYLAITSGEPARFIPAQDLSNIVLSSLLKTIRQGSEPGLLPSQHHPLHGVTSVLNTIETASSKSLDSMTLKDLASLPSDR